MAFKKGDIIRLKEDEAKRGHDAFNGREDEPVRVLDVRNVANNSMVLSEFVSDGKPVVLFEDGEAIPAWLMGHRFELIEHSETERLAMIGRLTLDLAVTEEEIDGINVEIDNLESELQQLASLKRRLNVDIEQIVQEMKEGK